VVSACSSFSGQPDLNGTSWMLTQLQGKSIVSPPIPTLIFKDGQVSGNASCNSFGGSYQRGMGETLKFGPLMSTMMACVDPSAMAQESDFLTMLASVVSYRVEGKKLMLYNVDSVSVAEFVQKP
jgi:heat shock protein HslJ